MNRTIRRFFGSFQTKNKSSPLKLSPEEETHLKLVSNRILSDPSCDISDSDASLFLYPKSTLFREAKYFPLVVDTISWSLYRRHVATSRLSDLTKERMKNAELQELFGLNVANFNHRVYWLTIHSWILHQRFLLDKLNKLESDYVDRIWLLPYEWMLEKGVARHRLQVELEHAHRYSLKFSVELDQALGQPDMLPGLICEVLWRTIFSEERAIKSASDTKVILLAKYIIRTLNFVLNSVPKDNFMQGGFIWPGMFEFYEPNRYFVQNSKRNREYRKFSARSMFL